MIVLSDNDVSGAVSALRYALESSDELREYVELLGIEFRELEDVGLRDDSSDLEIWAHTNEHGIVLLTGDRSERGGANSLGHVIRTYGTPDSLPVITIGNPERAANDRDHALRCSMKLIVLLDKIDQHRGVGRLYLS